MYNTIKTNNLTENEIYKTMVEFGNTILKNVALTDNNEIKAVCDLSITEKFYTIAVYNYNRKEIIRL